MRCENPTPVDDATGISLSPTLSVVVSDPDGDTMNVYFYNAYNDDPIGVDYDVSSGSLASVTWSGLSYSTTYGWYAIANDSQFENRSSTWNFATREPGFNIEIEIKGRVGVNAILKNTGNDDAKNVIWSISAKGKRFLSRIDASNDGVIDVINGNGDIVAKKLLVFGFGRIDINVTASCTGKSPVTKTADGFLIGYWVLIL